MARFNVFDSALLFSSTLEVINCFRYFFIEDQSLARTSAGGKWRLFPENFTSSNFRTSDRKGGSSCNKLLSTNIT